MEENLLLKVASLGIIVNNIADIEVMDPSDGLFPLLKLLQCIL